MAGSLLGSEAASLEAASLLSAPRPPDTRHSDPQAAALFAGDRQRSGQPIDQKLTPLRLIEPFS